MWEGMNDIQVVFDSYHYPMEENTTYKKIPHFDTL